MERRRRRRKKKQKSRFFAIAILLLVVLFICIGFGVSMTLEYFDSTSKQGKEVEVEIQEGDGIVDIANTLKEEGLIRHPLVFCLKAKSMGASANLRYGTFVLYEGLCMEDLINLLTTGGAKKEEVQLTIPEGYSVEKIAKKVEEVGICTEEAFLEAVQKEYDYDFLESVPENEELVYRLQGFLYPDTYAIGEDMTAEDVVRLMLDQFAEKYTSEMESQAQARGMTTFEVITKASIVEREAKVPEERSMIAGVIENRLNSNMALQMCPTALYPLTKGIYDKSTVSYEDTLIDSPYNTYQNKGLPVGPIASPGMASIEAVLNPTEHEYLFYHTNEELKDGSHIFTKTYEEHTSTQ